jgi:hypothetical protein
LFPALIRSPAPFRRAPLTPPPLNPSKTSFTLTPSALTKAQNWNYVSSVEDGVSYEATSATSATKISASQDVSLSAGSRVDCLRSSFFFCLDLQLCELSLL